MTDPSAILRWGWRGAAEPDLARVVRAHGDYYHLACAESPDGSLIARKRKAAFRDAEPPATGDFVRYAHNPSGESAIERVEPRFSKFERRDPAGRRPAQTLAVNFDVLFVVMSLAGDFSPARLARYVALARDAGRAETVVVLTKSDLAAGGEEEGLSGVAEGLEVVRVSAPTGEGMDAVRRHFAPGRTVALVGSSGVGKSTLLNVLAGREIAATQEVQEWSGRGRHTTTSRTLHMLPNGAMAIDTPGIREVGLVGERDAFLAKGVSTHRWRA